MKKKNLVVLAVLICCLLVFACFTKPDFYTITNGIFTSIIASFLFFIFTLLVDNSNEDIENKLTQMDKRISTIGEQINTYPAYLKNKLGIIKIEHRQEYSYDFWKAFLKDAIEKTTSKFIISGKTLHRWIEPEICDEFRSTLLKLISQKKEIIFVIYCTPPSNKKKQDLHEFLFKKIYPDLAKTCGYNLAEINKVFRLYEVDSMPYLYTAIDNQVVVAQYFSYTSNSENIMLVLDPSSSFARRYQYDFHCMIENKINNAWLEDFLNKYERKEL